MLEVEFIEVKVNEIMRKLVERNVNRSRYEVQTLLIIESGYP